VRASHEVVAFEGVVLHRRDAGESDLVVDFLGRGCGRVSLIARGARASKKRFPGRLELFAAIRAHVVPRGSLWTLQAADVLDARVALRGEWERWARAAVLVDCARALAAPSEANDPLLAALSEGLDRLAQGECARAVEFYPKALAAAGLPPDPGELPPDLAPAVLAVLGGAVCEDAAVADAVEARAVGLIEDLIGRALKSRSVL
jgi:recombinational DNA repair protein (RecF pathway)